VVMFSGFAFGRV